MTSRVADFAGKVCFVTGGGTGIGFAAAVELLARGATVVIGSRTVETLQKAVEALKSSKASYEVINIREEESVKKAVGAIMEKHGAIDCLVNNGGGQFASPAKYISAKGWRAVIDTNLNGTWLVTRSAFDATVKQREQGRPLSVVNVIVDNFTGFPGMVHTGAARAGVENMSLTLAREWGPEGVRINCVAPGIILSSGMDNYPEELLPGIFATGKSCPLGRCGTESECASAIVYLSSPGANYITGATLRVDGGGSLSKTDNMGAIPSASSEATEPFHFDTDPALRQAYDGRVKLAKEAQNKPESKL